MPKTSAEGGPSYDGFVDTSPAETVTPDWAAAEDVEHADVEAAPTPADMPRDRKRTRAGTPAPTTSKEN